MTQTIKASADRHTVWADSALEIVSAAQLPEEDWLRGAVARIAAAEHVDYVSVIARPEGSWAPLAETGHARVLPLDWLAQVLDQEAPAAAGDWAAAPLRPRSAGGELLIVRGGSSKTVATELVAYFAPRLAQSLDALREREREQARLRRLEAVQRAAARWYQLHEMGPLLHEMAEAATRLLDSDRASIFLWDRPNHSLVGRPALGIKGNELRVPDDAGVVGHVVRTGESRRIDRERDQALINRRVDQHLGYETRTLLCVPLRGGKGELFGAFEAINKRSGNFTDADEAILVELASHAAIALENSQERKRLLESRRQVAAEAAKGVQLIGASPAIQALRGTIARVADTELAVLILGENGAGKEVVAQMIHYLSGRRDQPFIAVNCAAITETLLESELFGHEKGAFTDAHESRAGKFELAHGGTLFLDEIGDLSLSGQAKLLRVLEEKVVVRVGGSKSIHTDARVIAATNQDLGAMVRDKRFRQDLFFRLNVVALGLPPLRERGDDVLLLAEHFLAHFCRQARREPPNLSAGAKSRLLAHDWPGNVRELRNLMERLAYLTPGDEVNVEDLALVRAGARDAPALIDADLPLSEATDTFQAAYIRQAIERTRGNMSQAAENLGLHRSNLYRKMRQLGMNPGP